MILMKIGVILLSGILNFIGGWKWHNARRFIMPLLLAVSASLCLHIWWIGLMVLPCIGTLILGYKRFGQGNFSRAMWLFVQFSVCGLGLFLTGHLAWYFYIPYCILGGVLGGTLVNVWQPIGDFIEGACLGSILLWIK